MNFLAAFSAVMSMNEIGFFPNEQASTRRETSQFIVEKQLH